MNRKVLATFALVFALGGMSAFAQTPETCEPCPAAECAKAECKGKKAKFKKDDFKKQARRSFGNKNSDPYQGMTLSEAQRQQLDALKKKRAEERRNKRRNMTIDTTLSREQMRAQADSARRADRIEYLHEVREIVGPDQYVIFLENIAVDGPAGKYVGNKPRRANKDKAHHRHGRHQGPNPQTVKTSMNVSQ